MSKSTLAWIKTQDHLHATTFALAKEMAIRATERHRVKIAYAYGAKAIHRSSRTIMRHVKRMADPTDLDLCTKTTTWLANKLCDYNLYEFKVPADFSPRTFYGDMVIETSKTPKKEKKENNTPAPQEDSKMERWMRQFHTPGSRGWQACQEHLDHLVNSSRRSASDAPSAPGPQTPAAGARGPGHWS